MFSRFLVFINTMNWLSGTASQINRLIPESKLNYNNETRVVYISNIGSEMRYLSASVDSGRV